MRLLSIPPWFLIRILISPSSHKPSNRKETTLMISGMWPLKNWMSQWYLTRSLPQLLEFLQTSSQKRLKMKYCRIVLEISLTMNLKKWMIPCCQPTRKESCLVVIQGGWRLQRGGTKEKKREGWAREWKRRISRRSRKWGRRGWTIRWCLRRRLDNGW